jgi:hypothetical protein
MCRFVCVDGDTVILDWPNIRWAQAWRLYTLFARLSGPGEVYIYFGTPGSMQRYVNFREAAENRAADYGGFVRCDTQEEVDSTVAWLRAHGCSTHVEELHDHRS